MDISNSEERTSSSSNASVRTNCSDFVCTSAGCQVVTLDAKLVFAYPFTSLNANFFTTVSDLKHRFSKFSISEQSCSNASFFESTFSKRMLYFVRTTHCGIFLCAFILSFIARGNVLLFCVFPVKMVSILSTSISTIIKVESWSFYFSDRCSPCFVVCYLKLHEWPNGSNCYHERCCMIHHCYGHVDNLPV